MLKGPVTFDELMTKRLIFVSGKGGVGKTSVATLIGTAAAMRKKNALLVEMNSGGRIPPLFDAVPAPDREIPLAPYLTALDITPKACFEEYVLMQIRFKAIYEVFFNNTFVTNFLGAVPGLNEILMLGKIYDLERRERRDASHAKSYDLVVVDMPATGHGLSAMEVPHVLQSVVKVGPLHANAVKMNALFADEARTAFCLVTLAEEMPVCETIEYAKGLNEKTDVCFGPLFVNGVMPEIAKIKSPKSALPAELMIYRDYHRLAESRYALNREYRREIARDFTDFTRIELPYRFEGLDHADDFRRLAEVLV
jgi:anion-transporting  ArsA/GET3 family ATPase